MIKEDRTRSIFRYLFPSSLNSRGPTSPWRVEEEDEEEEDEEEEEGTYNI